MKRTICEFWTVSCRHVWVTTSRKASSACRHDLQTRLDEAQPEEKLQRYHSDLMRIQNSVNEIYKLLAADDGAMKTIEGLRDSIDGLAPAT